MIEITNLTKYYGDVKILDIPHFLFQKNKKYALIGSNGSGKSTLLKIIAKLETASGSVKTDSNNIGYLPQQSYGFNMSVLNNVLLSYPFKIRKQNKANALQLIDSLDLMPLQNKNGGKLSGGETQRLALARLLTMPKDILLLDEPTASLDKSGTEKVENILKNYAKANNTTIIFATHSINQAENLADVIISVENNNLTVFK